MPQQIKKPDIKLVIFDLGNVIVLDTQRSYESKFGIASVSKYKRSKYETVTRETEKGLKPTSELMKVMKWAFGLPQTIAELEQMMIHTKLNKPVWNLLLKIKNAKKYKLAILTNNQKTWPAREEKILGISFKGISVYNSSYMKTRKPDRSAFEYVLKKEKVRPTETAFVDDKKENIDGAKRVGIQTVHFKGNYSDLVKGLKKLGIEVKIKRK